MVHILMHFIKKKVFKNYFPLRVVVQWFPAKEFLGICATISGFALNSYTPSPPPFLENPGSSPK